MRCASLGDQLASQKDEEREAAETGHRTTGNTERGSFYSTFKLFAGKMLT